MNLLLLFGKARIEEERIILQDIYEENSHLRFPDDILLLLLLPGCQP